MFEVYLVEVHSSSAYRLHQDRNLQLQQYPVQRL
jgi:hypothetical protein